MEPSPTGAGTTTRRSATWILPVADTAPGHNFEALARLYLVMSLVALKRDDRYYAASELIRGVSRADKHGIPWDTLRRVVSALLALCGRA